MSKSIVHDEKECKVCGTTLNLHRHHVFFGANRKNSEKYGCWCYLCAKHHNMSNDGVHHNKALDNRLKQLTQRKFEALHGHEKFMRIFGRNYL